MTLTVTEPAGVLAVTPAGDLVSAGPAGGPFIPSNLTYTLENTGGSSIDWTAAKTQTWTTLSATSGTLAAGATATVTVSIDAAASEMADGTYNDTVSFTNTTNGTGSTTRAVTLTISARPGALAVTPAGDFASSGVTRRPLHAGQPSLHPREHRRDAHRLDGRENPDLDDLVRDVRNAGRRGDGHGHRLDRHRGRRAHGRDLQRYGHLHQHDQRHGQHDPGRHPDRLVAGRRPGRDPGRRIVLVRPGRRSVHAGKPGLQPAEHGRIAHRLDGRENADLDDFVGESPGR